MKGTISKILEDGIPELNSKFANDHKIISLAILFKFVFY